MEGASKIERVAPNLYPEVRVYRADHRLSLYAQPLRRDAFQSDDFI